MSPSKHTRKKNLAGVPALNVLSPNDRELRERLKAFMLAAGIVGFRQGNTFVYYYRGRSKDLAGRLTIETMRTGDDWFTSFYHAATYATLHASLTARLPMAQRFPAFCEALGLDPRGEGLRAWEYAGQVDKELKKFLGDARYAELLSLGAGAHAAARNAQHAGSPPRARFLLRVTPGGFIALERAVANARWEELTQALRRGFREGEFRKNGNGYAFLPRTAEYRDTPGALALELARQIRDAGVAVAVAQEQGKAGAPPVKEHGRAAVGGTMTSKGTGAKRSTMAGIRGAKANGRAAAPADEREADELVLYAANDRPSYDRRQQFYATALKRVRGGTYDPAKAPALFVYLADEVAKRYRAEFRMGDTGFTPATRQLAAEKFAREFENSDEYAEAVAAKARGKSKSTRAKANGSMVVRREITTQGPRVNVRRPAGGYDTVAHLTHDRDAEMLAGAIHNAVDTFLRDNRGRHLRNPNAALTHREYSAEPYGGYYRVLERLPGEGRLNVVLSGVSRGDAEAAAGAIHNVLVTFQGDNGYAPRKANGAAAAPQVVQSKTARSTVRGATHSRRFVLVRQGNALAWAEVTPQGAFAGLVDEPTMRALEIGETSISRAAAIEALRAHGARGRGKRNGNVARTSRWDVQFIHKIHSRPEDRRLGVAIRDNAFADSKTLGKALRDAGVLDPGARVRTFRVEGDKVVVFPTMPGLTTYWHSVILTHAG